MHGVEKPFVCSSITPEKLERKARREKAICVFFNHTREIGEESTERKNHFVCSSITPEKLERKARRGKVTEIVVGRKEDNRPVRMVRSSYLCMTSHTEVADGRKEDD